MTNWKPNIAQLNRPLYRAIAEAIREGVESGELNPGDRLLPYRIMSDELGVTIGTVSRGYQLASEWGFVSSEVGRGSIIIQPETKAPHYPIDLNGAYIDMGFLKPTPTTDPELRKNAYEDTLKLIGQRWKNRAFYGYPPEFGHSHHREAGASWIRRRGIEASVDEVLLTTGSQEALHILLSAYTNPGDSILVEETLIPAIKSLSNILNLRAIGIQLDDQGLIPHLLNKAVKKQNSHILILTPTLQNPTTAVMSAERREEIAEIANRNNLFIIENDPFSEFVENPPHPITHYAPDRTAYVTTLSYFGSPEIRIGYVKLPKNKIPELQPVKRAFSISGSLLTAEIATHWINSGILERLTRWQTNEIKDRCSSIPKKLKNYKYQYSPYGLFLWLQLPEPMRAVDIVIAAKDRNVIVLEAERFMVGRGAAPHSVRISITSAQSKELFEEGLKILSELMNKSSRLSI